MILILASEARSAGLMPLDWTVIAAYAAGMLAVGWYYSRQTKTTEDYLLGGRQMKPLWVGLSLFVSLFSVITYLTLPGEMIRNGPTFIFGQIAAYPLVYLIVGLFLIPFIMRLKITSAYEILEIELGLSVRMLGSTFFLLMRLFWMAFILYATTDKVLLPLMGLSSSATPYICAVLGLVTVIYTSMGGLRAVVFTDAIQSMILFGGALLTIGLVTVHFGGVREWWPTEWPATWHEFQWGYHSDPKVRTVMAAFVATLAWYVCTTGSDQMAIQRYLATRDAPAARRMLLSSLVANALVSILLSIVGIALLAYFQANPQIPDIGENAVAKADKLFPLFIASGMPAGVSGLVIAGLLAAAMSSLSSGLNSSCSVIATDFIDRFRSPQNGETGHVKMAKYISYILGVVVVAISSIVGMVEGNLLEMTFKICNLLTAPLFGLFFMAMLVPWANSSGTLIGAFVGVATVSLLSFWEDMTGTPGISILWAMPLSLLAQILVGSLASLLFKDQRTVS